MRTALPQGRLLPDQAWKARHRGIVGLLWALIPALALFGVLRGKGLTHSALETLPVISMTIVACLRGLSRRVRGLAAALGLLMCSAAFVHLWNGQTEAHFSFFVVVTLLMLYEDWAVFAVAIVFVIVHHTVIGFIDPGSVFEHADSRSPLRWGLIHGAFVLAASIANMVSWRASEQLHRQSDRHRSEAELERARRLETVGQLAGGVAHDFNNLLAVIVNCAALARHDLPDGCAEEEIAGIEDAAARGARLVRQLLLFSQSRSGEPALIDLNAVAEGMNGLLSRTLGSGVRLRCELDGEPLLASADLSGLEQVLVNLVVNARDAVSATGTITIHTDAIRIDADEGAALKLPAGRYVRLSVSDDGCGMDAETLARANEPFFTTKGHDGTGLGLATVFGFAEKAGGSVTIDSWPGAGTTVRLLLAEAQAGAPAGLQLATA